MGASKYIESLVVADLEPVEVRVRRRGIPGGTISGQLTAPELVGPSVVDGGSLISFVAGLSAQEMRDVLYSVQLAQRGASGAFSRFDQSRQWYDKYCEILSQVGWAGEQLAFKEYSQAAGRLEMDKAALEVIAEVATGQQLTVLAKSLDALRKLSDGGKPITLFEYNALTQASCNFQVGAVQKTPGEGALSMGLGGFYFHAGKREGQFLVFSWGSKSVLFWAAVQKLTLNCALYAEHREVVEKKLGVQAAAYLSGLELA